MPQRGLWDAVVESCITRKAQTVQRVRLQSRTREAETDVRRLAKNVAGLAAEVEVNMVTCGVHGLRNEADMGGWGTTDRSEPPGPI